MNQEQATKLVKYVKGVKITVNFGQIKVADDVAKSIRFQSIGYGDHHDITPELLSCGQLHNLNQHIANAGSMALVVAEYHELHDEEGRYSTTRTTRRVRCLTYHYDAIAAVQQLVDYLERRSSGKTIEELYGAKEATSTYVSYEQPELIALNLREVKTSKAK